MTTKLNQAPGLVNGISPVLGLVQTYTEAKRMGKSGSHWPISLA